ncbi:MAG TPA: hypothetical protein VM142_01460 [Acidimicrobiales bacterium]|nr:hypothetical protein [Acidimicrobiales bacterium]
MRTLTALLPGLACAGGMAVMMVGMWVMGRGRGAAAQTEPQEETDPSRGELARLQEELRRLHEDEQAAPPRQSV